MNAYEVYRKIFPLIFWHIETDGSLLRKNQLTVIVERHCEIIPKKEKYEEREDLEKEVYSGLFLKW